jgi:hypothetical protein
MCDSKRQACIDHVRTVQVGNDNWETRKLLAPSHVGSTRLIIEAAYQSVLTALDDRPWWLWGNQWNEWLAGEPEVVGENLP